MAFADPQSVTINAVATSLPRTGSGVSSGSFTSADGAVKLDVSHQYARRNRSQYRLTQTKTAADAIIPSQNVVLSASVYLVVDRPKNGFSVTELGYLIAALAAEMTESSGARAAQLLGGES